MKLYEVFIGCVLLVGVPQLVFSGPADIFEKCTLGAPDLNDCAIKTVKNAIPKVLKDYASIGLPNVEPMDIKKFEIPASGSGAVRLAQKYTDAKLSGLSSLQVTKIKIDPKTLAIEGTVIVDLGFTGHYDLDGKILIMPMKGNGQFDLKADKAEIGVKLTNEIYEKDGKKYVRATNLDLELLKTDKVHFNFDNLFNGDKKLSDNVNKFLNEHVNEFIGEFKKPLQKSFSELFMKYYNEVAPNFPLEMLVTDVASLG